MAALLVHRLNDVDHSRKGLIWRWVATHPQSSLEAAVEHIVLNSDTDTAYRRSLARSNYIRDERSACLRALRAISTVSFPVAQGENLIYGGFDPSVVLDLRKKVLATIAQRQGQGQFRSKLFAAYNSQCAISKTSVRAVLDAAHIHPYLGRDSNSVNNGLLLRTDLHTLFDLFLIFVSPDAYVVSVSPELRCSYYGQFHGVPISDTAVSSQRPSQKSLQWHRSQCEW
ncbi:MAG: HNH endonuclease [Pseudomonadota bacterium]|nr:HNH endonuclease [Pseudomonadota bacterium]